MTVASFGKSGVNLNGALDTAMVSVTVRDNGGAGVFAQDVHGLAIDSIATTNNQWCGLALATWGRYHALAAASLPHEGALNLTAPGHFLNNGRYLERVADKALMAPAGVAVADANLHADSVGLKFVIDARASAADIVADLSSSMATLQIQDAAGYDVTVALTDCGPKRNKPEVVLCDSGAMRAQFEPVNLGPGIYKSKLRADSLTGGSDTVVPPVTFVLSGPTAMLTGMLDSLD
jgi:hypothetical protein